MTAPPVVLDWRRHQIGRRPGKCRLCDRPAWLRDAKGRPCHKVCAEAAATRAAAAYAGRKAAV